MRLDIERQKDLEPQRMEHAIRKIQELGIKIEFKTENEIRFVFNGSGIKFFPYSGWHTGAKIKDGRGLDKLLKQLK